MDWSNAEFADSLAGLPDEVADIFGLPPADAAPAAHRLTLGQMDKFLSASRTAAVLAELQFPEDLAPPPPLYGFVGQGLETGAQRLAETTDTRLQFDQLLDTLDALRMLNDLAVTGPQLAAMRPVATRMQSDYIAQRGSWRALLSAQHADLLAVRATLVAGSPLSDRHNAVLYDLQDREGTLALEVLDVAAASLSTVRDALNRDQNMLIDWRPPELPGQSEALDCRIERLLDLADRIVGFTNFLKEVRFIEPIGFQDGAPVLTGDFLAQYMRDNTRHFDRAVKYMIDKEIEAREVPEEDWNDTVAAMIAIDAMSELRLLPRDRGLNAPLADDILYNWWDMERFFSDPLLPHVFIRMLQPAAPQQPADKG
jgi:hypothetical protein